MGWAMRPPHKLWRTLEIRAVNDALNAGAHPAKIGRGLAAQLGRTVRAVTRYARKLHRERLHPAARQTARRWTAAEYRAIDATLAAGPPCRAVAIPLAKRLRRSVNTVLRVLHARRTRAGGPKTKHPWTEAEYAQMRQMRAAGETWAAIAAHLGRPASSTRNKATALGLTTKRRA